MADSEVRLVLVTAPADAAASLARTLVQERLVACVNMTSVRSVFRWEGEVQEDEERLLLLKTSAGRLPTLEARVRALHDYDCPEFIALDVSSGAEAYLRWVVDEVRPCDD